MKELQESPEIYEARQRAHYDRIAEAYDAHYSDKWSLLYRRLFLYEPLIAGIDLRGRKVLDAMCGSGQTAAYLLRRNAQSFDFVSTRYSGGPAYLLVFNSMVFRVPLSWKARYTRPLLWLERRLERIQGKRLSCFAMAQWRKKA